MIDEIKASCLLKGFRGSPPLDTEIILKIIKKISEISLKYKAIKEIDLNPVIIYKNGAKIVDARFMIE